VIAIVVGRALPGAAVAVYVAVALYVVIPWRQVTRIRRPADVGGH
jgi:hypothetical protein